MVLRSTERLRLWAARVNEPTCPSCGIGGDWNVPGSPHVGGCHRWERLVVTHACPPHGSGVMPCCGLTPFERRADRMTLDMRLVTCDNVPTHAYRIGWWTHKWWPTRELLLRAITGRHTVDTIRPVTVKGRRKPYWQALWRRARLIRPPHLPWQAESRVHGCSCNAARGFTSTHARNNVRRLHLQRMMTPVTPGVPVGGRTGVCWAALDEEEKAACQ